MRVALPVLALVIVAGGALAAVDPEEGAEGVIVIGTGGLNLVSGLDFSIHLPPGDTLGMDVEGDVLTSFEPNCHGDSCGWEVQVFSAIGTHDVAYRLTWVFRGEADVWFGPPIDPT